MSRVLSRPVATRHDKRRPVEECRAMLHMSAALVATARQAQNKVPAFWAGTCLIRRSNRRRHNTVGEDRSTAQPRLQHSPTAQRRQTASRAVASSWDSPFISPYGVPPRRTREKSRTGYCDATRSTFHSFALADTAQCRKNRIRSSRLALVSGVHRILCSRRKIGTRWSASSPRCGARR